MVPDVPEGTPEQDLLEALFEIERKPPAGRTPEEAAQMAVLERWYLDTCRLWGCRRYGEVWRQGYDWPRHHWTYEARDRAIRAVRAARIAFVLARAPRERLGAYRFDGLERWFFDRARTQLQS
jgi:hypothetical protein